MTSSGESFPGTDVGNATEYLLAELLKVVKDKIATDDSATDWDPITFAFTVPVGIFGILATLFAFVTIIQGIFAASPGRRKSSRRVIGKWAETRWTTVLWDELRTTTFVKTPILRADSLYEALQVQIESLGAETKESLAPVGNIQARSNPRAMVSTEKHVGTGGATQANWVKLLAQFHLDDIEFREEDLEITATDHIPDELRSVYAYTDIRTMVALGAIAGASNLEPESGSSYPILIGTETQIDFRQHPLLGTVVAFSQYGKQRRQLKEISSYSGMSSRALMMALQHSNAEVEYTPPNANSNVFGSPRPSVDSIHVISAVDSDELYKGTTPQQAKEIIYGIRDYKYSREWHNHEDCLCRCEGNWYRFAHRNLFWMFVAKAPREPPRVFPSSYVAIRKSLTTLCLQSRFWSQPRVNQSIHFLYHPLSSTELPERFKDKLDEFRGQLGSYGDTICQNCLQVLSGNSESVRGAWLLEYFNTIHGLLEDLDSTLAILPIEVVGCRKANLFLTTLILREISCGIEDGNFKTSNLSSWRYLTLSDTQPLHEIHTADGTIMQEHLYDLRQLDMFLSRAKYRQEIETSSSLFLLTNDGLRNLDADQILSRLKMIVRQCAATGHLLQKMEEGKVYNEDTWERDLYEIVDDIIIWKTILIGVLFCSAPDNSTIFQSAVWNHVIPLL
ncbi:hypothetical protein PFICI_00780 [Pestalotiopsis fici W106-1]|uniref:Uncharacterized protein n=1 Tax=Pestalotiopsis fici (strain W106-1 / CGMCC3.15140) TaxID=1229662 RepID=W3XN61_PESFW|nr:uncharacterized protein PFICI_00780 [Pestalotiopsis fici W106-1]ETS86952.1 hypothetical protein PFICI_00780 [Pestalotiopsis fici W106-1]